MGNQLLKTFEIQKDSYLEGGIRQFWKVHSASHFDEKDKSVFSAFIFKKKVLKGKNIPNPIKDEVYAILKKEPQNLAKLKHPSILSVAEPLIEHSKCLVYATERVLNSLQGLIKAGGFAEIYRSEVEFKLHLKEIIDGVSFLHNNAKIAHLNICPENIYVTEQNKWKISGLNFSNWSENKEKPIFKENDAILKEFPAIFQPNPSYSAPEIFDSSNKLSICSDIFSLGMLMLTILSNLEEKTSKEGLFNCTSISKHKDELTNFIAQLETFPFFQKLHPNLKFILSRMLNLNPNSRPIIQEVSACQWLNDPLVQTLNYLDSLNQRDETQQTAFFKGLVKIIGKFEHKIIKKRIFPRIIEFIQKDHCSSAVLQIILAALEINGFVENKEEFANVLWPGIKSLTAMKEISAQSLFLLVNGLPKLSEYLTNADLQSSLLPLLLKCYDCGVGKLEEAILKNTEYLVKKLEFSLIKNRVLPKVLKLSADEKHETRKGAIVALSKICTIFDKTTVNEQIMPTLEKTLKKSNDPELTFAVLNMYDGMSKIIGIEGITTKIVPQLIPPLGEKSIGKEEFMKRYEILLNLIKRVYDEKMKEFQSISDDQLNEKKKLDKAINDIEEISKSKTEIQKKPEESNDDFDFLKLFDKNIALGEKSIEKKNSIEIATEEKKKNEFQVNQTSDIEITKPLGLPPQLKNDFGLSLDNKRNSDIDIQKPLGFPPQMKNTDMGFNMDPNPSFQTPVKQESGSIFNKDINSGFLANSNFKKSHNPFEEMLSTDKNTFNDLGNNFASGLKNSSFNPGIDQIPNIINLNPVVGNFFSNNMQKEITGIAIKNIEKNPEKMFDFVDDLIKPQEKNPFQAFSASKFNVTDEKKQGNSATLKGPFENSFDLI